MPSIEIRFHAVARELAGVRSATLAVAPPADRASLVAAIATAFPRLEAAMPKMRIAVDDAFADDAIALREGAIVDLLPPVAGGSHAVVASVSEEPLSLDAAYDAVVHPGAGGIALFVGVVRDHADGKPVARLDYEHHATLAVAEMRRVLETIVAERPGVRLAAMHRVGTLAVGDRAVVIAASAAHRAEAFAACREAIDRIKETVPIWKKEWGPDEQGRWVRWDEVSG